MVEPSSSSTSWRTLTSTEINAEVVAIVNTIRGVFWSPSTDCCIVRYECKRDAGWECMVVATINCCDRRHDNAILMTRLSTSDEWLLWREEDLNWHCSQLVQFLGESKAGKPAETVFWVVATTALPRLNFQSHKSVKVNGIHYYQYRIN